MVEQQPQVLGEEHKEDPHQLEDGSSVEQEREQSIMPQEQPPSINLSDTLYREIFMSMRVQLWNDALFG